ncbi:MAG: ribonuclease R [Bacteroidetes bacterium]|nr:ribonuclease R [Bacteroidota bacterium]
MPPRTPPRQLRKEILEVFKRQPNKPLNHKQVASSMGILNHDTRRKIMDVMDEMGRDGRLEPLGRGKFVLAEIPQDDRPTGTIQITRHGKGYVMLPDGNEIMIPKGYTGTAFWGDTVEVDWIRRGRRHTPRVKRVMERARKQYVVVIERVRDYAFGYPSDQRLHVNFFIGAPHLGGAEDGQKVIIEMIRWDDPSDAPSARVTEVLGRPGEHEVEMHAILAEFGLPYEFPEHVLEAASAISREVSPDELKRRRDFRGVTTLTIDPVDAKDFDDALSLKRLDNGNWEVGVHIADVTHYLKPGTALDEEARQRATSVYLVDRTIPMLPEVLSNDLCSLRPNEDRLAFAAVFELDEKANIVNEWFGRTVIHSDRRFAYHEAQERIETGQGDFAEEVQTLQSLAAKLRAKRFAAGGIDFNTEEVKFELDEAGKPLRVVIKRMLEANRLIEDFMLLANVRVSRFLANPKKRDGRKEEATRTAVYRIHDRPDPEKLSQLRKFVSKFGLDMPKINPGNSESALRELLQTAAGSDAENVVKTMAIRSMAKAEYSTENIGHYGLAFPFYTHFTSPIRRYPDVLVHRLVQHYLDQAKPLPPGPLVGICQHSSNMEKQAAEAERASIKYKQVEFLMTRLGETFHGIINGVVPKGIFVELEENKCEGFVPKDALPDDYYVYDEDRQALVGARHGQHFAMGERVSVRVVAADLAKRQLEFDIPDA